MSSTSFVSIKSFMSKDFTLLFSIVASLAVSVIVFFYISRDLRVSGIEGYGVFMGFWLAGLPIMLFSMLVCEFYALDKKAINKRLLPSGLVVVALTWLSLYVCGWVLDRLTAFQYSFVFFLNVGATLYALFVSAVVLWKLRGANNSCQ